MWYSYPHYFRELMVNGMSYDFSWNHPGYHYLRIYEHIRERGTLPEDVEGKLRNAIEDFKEQFAPSEAEKPKDAEADELEGEEQEKMKRVRRTPPKQEG